MARKLAFPAAIAALALALSACGDNGDNGDTDTTDNGVADNGAEDNGAADNGDDSDASGNLPDLRAEYDSDDWPDTLQFVSIPSEDSVELAEQYAVLLEMFEEALGVEINASEVTSYAAAIEALGAETADIANFGPFSYVTAADTVGAQPVAVAINEPGEEPSYNSYLVVRSDNDEINAIEDLEGKTVCVVDQLSTSGYLYPTAGLMEAGLTQGEDYEIHEAGAHDNSVLAVMDGTCDAGFAYDTMVDEQMIANGSIEEGDVKVVWVSEDIPSAPFAAGAHLPESLQEAMQQILLEYMNTEWLAENGYCENPEPGREAEHDCSGLVPTGRYGYIEATDEVFNGIRAVCEITQAAACEE